MNNNTIGQMAVDFSPSQINFIFGGALVVALAIAAMILERRDRNRTS